MYNKVYSFIDIMKITLGNAKTLMCTYGMSLYHGDHRLRKTLISYACVRSHLAWLIYERSLLISPPQRSTNPMEEIVAKRRYVRL